MVAMALRFSQVLSLQMAALVIILSILLSRYPQLKAILQANTLHMYPLHRRVLSMIILCYPAYLLIPLYHPSALNVIFRLALDILLVLIIFRIDLIENTLCRERNAPNLHCPGK